MAVASASWGRKLGTTTENNSVSVTHYDGCEIPIEHSLFGRQGDEKLFELVLKV